ncbi:GNAT family N-acetyltransferase [Paenibacillus sp. SAF-054]
MLQVEPEDFGRMEKLLQLYAYDFSEFTGADVDGDTGLYRVMPDFEEYWDGIGNRSIQWITVSGQIAGFAMMQHKREKDSQQHVLSHFFVLRKYRLHGVGKQAASQLFTAYAGRWELCQLEANVPAQRFWRKVIESYTYGSYHDRFENGRFIQEFTSQ